MDGNQNGYTIEEVKRRCPVASRMNHPEDTVIRIGDHSVGGGSFTLIAGPCSVESREQMLEIARSVKRAGASMLRGGAFKPRTSPYEFQGLGEEGLRLLLEAGQAVGLPVVTEIVAPRWLPLYQDVDVLQVGARNMQNYDLLRELGKLDKPVLLKRGMSNTLQELLLSAEYILSAGNSRVILCERGIRTFETATRNTLDLSAVPVLHQMTHLPVLVDPSHAAGNREYVAPLALAAAAVGADGLMVEVHNAPEQALSDGPQALLPDEFASVARRVAAVRAALTGTSKAFP